jgi:DNA helicase-2/ATP-dependent DNA helicase PcrA
MVARYAEAGGFEDVPLEVEHPFEIGVDGFTLRGVIDRLDGPAAAGAPHRLIDYKTGASLPAARLRRDFQVALYALAAQRGLGLGELELELAYLRDGKRVRLPATAELLKEAEQLARDAVAGIESGDFEPRPERRRCRVCAYRLACDAAL